MPDQKTDSPKTVDSPVLVVGTTPDYVVKIYHSYQKPVLFLMDIRFREDPLLNKIDKSALVFSPLNNFDMTVCDLTRHFNGSQSRLRGVACFDCESLILAGRLAEYFQKPFPSPKAIARARNKFESRRLWMEKGVETPKAVIASNLNQSMIFFQRIKRPIILKPISSSGSELVFKCQNEREIGKAVRILRKQLFKRLANPFFTDIKREAVLDPCQTWIAEEFIRGPEYSCDFILNQGKVILVRETGKIKAPDQTFGTVLAYTCPPVYPKGFSYENLYEILGKAADALGFSHGYFMTDFIVSNGKVYIIEITPRPGGDSIPDLIKTASGYDILNGYLEFICENKSAERSFLPLKVNTCAGINFYADRAGVISQLNYSELLADPMVKNVIFKKQPGDRVVLPPDNYDDRLLGYCIVALNSSRLHHSQYRSLQRRLKVSITN